MRDIEEWQRNKWVFWEAWSETLKCCFKWLTLLNIHSKFFCFNWNDLLHSLCPWISLFVFCTWLEGDKLYNLESDCDLPSEDDITSQSFLMLTCLQTHEVFRDVSVISRLLIQGIWSVNSPYARFRPRGILVIEPRGYLNGLDPKTAHFPCSFSP